MSNATGTQSDARFETSAAWAEAEASNNKLAAQVERNAEKLHDVAQDAAIQAQFKSPAAAVNNLEHGLSEKTDDAVAEGQVDAQGYVAQAKNLANSAMATAQSYLPNSSDAAKDGTGRTTASLQSTASSAFQTTKEYIASATNAAAPVANSALNASIAAMETAKTTAAPYVQSAADAVSRAVSGNAQSGNSTNGMASKTAAPLQTGGQAVRSPYTTNGEKPNVADV